MKKGIPIFEKLLIKRLKNGDHSAFSELFSTYYNDLIMFALTFTRELSVSEEIVQDTFARFWENHESININTSLQSFLLKTVQNRCIDWLRHRKIVNDYSSYIINTVTNFEYDTDNFVLWSELNDQIEKAVSAMPEEIKQVFVMNRFERLKYQEISAKLNIPIKLVEVRICKALQILRNELRDFIS